MGKPWSGCFRRPHPGSDSQFFSETGARNGKLKVYEMVYHPAARALTGDLLVRGGASIRSPTRGHSRI